MSGTAFNESLFEKKLLQLRETHESISNLSSWCLANQSHHTKIISIWLSVLKRVKIEHRLLLFYLANDVIQYSRRKHLPFVEAFAPALQKATTMVREDSVKNKVLRLFKIWDDRGIYDEAFLLDLSGLLICDLKGGNRMDVQDFQPNVMYSRIRSCKKLEDDTDLKLKVLNESDLPITNVEKLRKTLKDREHSEDVMEDVEQALTKIKAYIDALEAEIKERSGLLDMLDTSEQYYEKDLKEAKIVVNAYKCFGQRVKQVQKKLDEKIPSLRSPVPSPPDINAPSPSPPMSPEEERDFNPGNFTMGESFINNTSVIEKALDSQNNSFYDERQDYYPPGAVYTPSMTTGGHVRENVPYTPTVHDGQYDLAANTSFNSHYSSSENVYNNSSMNNTDYDSDQYASSNARNVQYNSDSQLSNDSYPAEYFIGANSSDATAYLDEREDKTRMDSSVFSSLMDSQGGLLPPPPPPPPPPKSPVLEIESKPDENKIEVIVGSSKHPSLAEILQSLIGKKEKCDVSTPMKPPPRPPTGLQEEEDEAAETWNENDWDSPMSPPAFQDFPTLDTDMRPKDIDHRNLISLTGWDSKDSKDEMSKDKDDRQIRSGLYHDSDSSDSRSPPDHIPRLNLPPLDIPPPKIPVLSPAVVVNHDRPQLNLPPTNLPPPNMPPIKLQPPPSIPPPLMPPINFEEIPMSSSMPFDNVENIDMEMSDEEDRREVSPINKRPALVPLTPDDEEMAEPLMAVRSILPPPPSPDISLLNQIHCPPHIPRPRLESPLRPPRPPRMMGPPTPDRPWLPHALSPHRPHRPMFPSPRQPFFQQGPPRPFRPRHFRPPRFQARW